MSGLAETPEDTFSHGVAQLETEFSKWIFFVCLSALVVSYAHWVLSIRLYSHKEVSPKSEQA